MSFQPFENILKEFSQSATRMYNSLDKRNKELVSQLRYSECLLYAVLRPNIVCTCGNRNVRFYSEGSCADPCRLVLFSCSNCFATYSGWPTVEKEGSVTWTEQM